MMKKFALTLLFMIALSSYTKADVPGFQNEGYLLILRQTSDSLLTLKFQFSGTYYIIISSAIYNRAIDITQAENNKQGTGPQKSFVTTIQRLLEMLHKDLQQDSTKINKVSLPPLMEGTVKAALNNFKRYEQPDHLNKAGIYCWTMIQVFENLNQINVGLLQAKLTASQRAEVIKRITVQQKIIEQLKCH